MIHEIRLKQRLRGRQRSGHSEMGGSCYLGLDLKEQAVLKLDINQDRD